MHTGSRNENNRAFSRDVTKPEATILVHMCVHSIMVICIVVGCSKRSDRDKDVSFYRIPSVRTGRSSEELELSKKRREGFLAAISRADLTETKLENGRICSRHFISGKPADLFDSLNPD